MNRTSTKSCNGFHWQKLHDMWISMMESPMQFESLVIILLEPTWQASKRKRRVEDQWKYVGIQEEDVYDSSDYWNYGNQKDGTLSRPESLWKAQKYEDQLWIKLCDYIFFSVQNAQIILTFTCWMFSFGLSFILICSL